jgi:hypothetical protein
LRNGTAFRYTHPNRDFIGNHNNPQPGLIGLPEIDRPLKHAALITPSCEDAHDIFEPLHTISYTTIIDGFEQTKASTFQSELQSTIWPWGNCPAEVLAAGNMTAEPKKAVEFQQAANGMNDRDRPLPKLPDADILATGIITNVIASETRLKYYFQLE